ncbi:MAG: signal peptidase II [Chthonomonadales bacterium]
MRPVLFYVAVLAILAGDQVSKWAVSSRIPVGASIPAIDHVLYLTHTRNTGGAFSLLQARNTVFEVVAVMAMAALIFAYHRSRKTDLLHDAAIALALGGAAGNLADRLRFGSVVDFFDLRWWPVFNVADAAITVGIIFLAWGFLTSGKGEEAAPSSDPP